MSVVGEVRESGWRVGQRLSPRQKAALAWEIVTTYVRVRYVLVRHSSNLAPTLQALRSQPIKPKSHEGGTPLEAGLRLGSALRRTLALLPADSRCLMRSLVLTSLLARRGIQSELIIGVHRDDEDEFGAHAWVEYQGRPLLPPGDEYTRLAEL